MADVERWIGWTNWPTPLLRAAIRLLLRRRLAQERMRDGDGSGKLAFLDALRRSPVALGVDDANDQHYEVPTDYFRHVLGPHMKYSSGYWPEGVDSLADSEKAMLDLTCERAELADGQSILELGCGWGSLTLHMARTYPRSHITAVSNSATQREHILNAARAERLDNIAVRTTDVSELSLDQTFDRVVSVEMFEHLRNYSVFLERVASWLAPDGKVFIHIFGHRQYAYPFEDEGESSWMARNFFLHGIMPSADLLLHFQDHLALEARWNLNGVHYHRTCEAWLRNHEAARREIEALFATTYGADVAFTRWMAWKIFYLACSELFAFDTGRQWMVYHYRFRKR